MENPIKLTVSQLAEAIRRKPQAINVYIKRKKLIKTGKVIDFGLPLNKLWLDSWLASGNEFNILASLKQGKPTPTASANTTTPTTPEKYDLSELAALELQKKKAELKRIETTAELNSLKIAKFNAEFVDLEASKHILAYIIESFRAQYLQSVDSLAELYKARFDITQAEFVGIKKDYTQTINSIASKAVKQMQNELDDAALEISEKLERGQKKNS